MKNYIIITISFFFSFNTFAQSEITLEDIWLNYKFYPKSYQGYKSMNDGEHFTRMFNDNKLLINKYSFETGEIVDQILNIENKELSNISNYDFNFDEDKILISTNTESIYRYSTKSNYFLYDINTEEIVSILDKKIMYAKFSPNGKNIAYIFENNIYIYNILSKNHIQVTIDGEKNKIINGASDWVYEEEFALVDAFEWSNDSKYLSYYKFDESKVKEFSMEIYNNQLYPTQKVFKYPKAGEENSKLSIYLYNITTNKSKLLISNEKYEYFPRIKWFDSNEPKLVIYGMNRHQNNLDFIIIDTHGNKKILFSESDKYYIDIHDNLTYLPKTKSFIWTSEKDGYNHIYIKDLFGNERQVTFGNWEVTKFYGIDNKDNIYYSSNESGTINSSMYKMNLNSYEGSGILMTKSQGTSVIKFSTGMKYFVNSYSNHTMPPYITLNRSFDGKLVKVLEENNELKESISEYILSEKEFFTIKVEDSVNLNAWMIKPNNFNPNKEYPLFMFLYGGPGSQQVTNSWDRFNYFWYQILIQKGYIIVCVDNRGTGGKGSEFKKMTYQELGKYETIDQINAAKYFSNLNYIDSKRIGIQGWSYGGYMSTLALCKGSDIFKMAIAVAPVTNWRYYDNIYTERYMRTPQENPNGYDENSPINHVDKIKGSYLLIHGSSDDNVHLQNTMEMISALVKANKQFDLYIYTDKNHGIYGGNTRFHLYKKMTDFIIEKL